MARSKEHLNTNILPPVNYYGRQTDIFSNYFVYTAKLRPQKNGGKNKRGIERRGGGGEGDGEEEEEKELGRRRREKRKRRRKWGRRRRGCSSREDGRRRRNISSGGQSIISRVLTLTGRSVKPEGGGGI